MDIRGVEITNQLRSAIRAKLIELGVRYDEELPDYILVMVVNKKSRQQMNEDLNLFLEDNTDTFVNWLHDQVLKKLQKVTVAKKKKITPSAVVKQEDEKKIKSEEESKDSLDKSEVVTKQERDKEFEELVGDLALLNEEDSKTSFNELELSEKELIETGNSTELIDEGSIDDYLEKETSNKDLKTFKAISTEKKETTSKLPHKTTEKLDYFSDGNQKRTSNILDDTSNKKILTAKRQKISYDSSSDSDTRLKSSISKPKLTSVVSVKSRLGVTSPSKKIESSSKFTNDARIVLKKNHEESKRKETLSEKSSLNDKNTIKRKLHNEDSKTDISRKEKSQSKKLKSDKTIRLGDLRDEIRVNKKSGTIKSRLGLINMNVDDNISSKSSSTLKVSKPKVSNVKSRLGIKVKSRESSVELPDYIDEDDDAESILNSSLKSHIIAVKNPKIISSKSKSSISLKKKNELNKIIEKDSSDNSEEDDAQSKFPSKVIVTPRPLKPLQPFQRRATQSLLLKAVAEANKSVVMQKKVDPCLQEQKAKKKIKIVRDPKKGKVVSINLNPKKKAKSEKIKIELPNSKRTTSKPRPSKAVRSEHLNLVKSLFKKSDDKQKFLVTLSGYNNNIFEENDSENEEEEEVEEEEAEDMEMTQLNEDDEIHYVDDSYDEMCGEEDQIISDFGNDINEEDLDIVEVDYSKGKKGKRRINENQVKNNKKESPPKKKKKINPIVYTKSRSNSPENKPSLASAVTSVTRIEKRAPMSSVITTVDKSSELCRYWPACTLGINCAYHHPEVPCSSFPACKFGEKCAYKHPNCKFGSSCTKVGCIFSHPPVQCKYHPYCMKPGCPFSHPKTSAAALINAPLTPDLSSVRAKFTWKKKD